MVDFLEGQEVPNVMLLPYSGGGKISFPKDIKGHWTLLYFYPKDDTPGCTKQACNYRDNISAFEKMGVKVFGVSSDPMPSHHAFISKYQLNFHLIADLHNILSGAFGSFGEQERNGKMVRGISRDTFLINPDAIVVKAWRKVNPENTVEETRKFIEQTVTSGS